MALFREMCNIFECTLTLQISMVPANTKYCSFLNFYLINSLSSALYMSSPLVSRADKHITKWESMWPLTAWQLYYMKFTLRSWANKTVFIWLAPLLVCTTKQLRQPLLLPIEYLVYFLIVENSIFYLPTDYDWRIFRLLKQQSVNYWTFEHNAYWGSEITRQNFLQSKCH